MLSLQHQVGLVIHPCVLRENELSLVDEIYDSFGITIPLIQFHNTLPPTFNETADAPVSETAERDTSDANLDDESDRDDVSDWDDEEPTESPKDQREKKQNTFVLEFADNEKLATEHHPYIVTRFDFLLLGHHISPNFLS